MPIKNIELNQKEEKRLKLRNRTQMEEKIKDAFREAMDNDDIEIELMDIFRNYEDWDSLAYLSMIAALDEEFGVEIENEEFEKLETVQDLVDAVRGKVKSGK